MTGKRSAVQICQSSPPERDTYSDAGVSFSIDMSFDAYMPTSRAFSPLRTGKSTLMHPIGPPEPLGVRLVLKWEGRIGRWRGDGGIRISANASRKGSRVPGRDDGVPPPTDLHPFHRRYPEVGQCQTFVLSVENMCKTGISAHI